MMPSTQWVEVRTSRDGDLECGSFGGPATDDVDPLLIRNRSRAILSDLPLITSFDVDLYIYMKMSVCVCVC